MCACESTRSCVGSQALKCNRLSRRKPWSRSVPRLTNAEQPIAGNTPRTQCLLLSSSFLAPRSSSLRLAPSRSVRAPRSFSLGSPAQNSRSSATQRGHNDLLSPLRSSLLAPPPACASLLLVRSAVLAPSRSAHQHKTADRRQHNADTVTSCLLIAPRSSRLLRLAPSRSQETLSKNRSEDFGFSLDF